MSDGIFNAVVDGDAMGVWDYILENYKSFTEDIIIGKAYPDRDMYCKFFHSQSQVDRMRKTGTASVLSTIGCPFHCTFCHSGSDSFQLLPIESVAAYVLQLYNEYGVRCFHFVDDLFAGNLKRLKKFRAIIEESFPDFSISSQVSGKPSTFTREIAAELVKLGVETINFGVETASPRMLTFIRKQQTVDHCYRAIEICHEFGLNAVINLMFGIPTQTAEDYEHTVNYVSKAQPDSITTFYYSPYPGTVLYDYCFDNGYMPRELDRNRFDWFEAEVDGISDIQLKLQGVDYAMARKYMAKTKKIMNRDVSLFNRIEVIDSAPWVLVGTSRHFYFKRILKKLSKNDLKNCLGYINLDDEIGFQLDDAEITIPEYRSEDMTQLVWAATYAFLGADYKVLETALFKYVGLTVPLVSISSFKKSHSVEEIKSLKEDLIN